MLDHGMKNWFFFPFIRVTMSLTLLVDQGPEGSNCTTSPFLNLGIKTSRINLSWTCQNLVSRFGNKTNMESASYSFRMCEGKLTAIALPYFFYSISLCSIVYRSMMTHVMLQKICKNLNMPIELKLSSRYALYPVVFVCVLFVRLTFLYLSLLFWLSLRK